MQRNGLSEVQERFWFLFYGFDITRRLLAMGATHSCGKEYCAVLLARVADILRSTVYLMELTFMSSNEAHVPDFARVFFSLVDLQVWRWTILVFVVSAR